MNPWIASVIPPKQARKWNYSTCPHYMESALFTITYLQSQTKKEGIFASTPSIAYAFLPLRYFSDVDIISRKASAQIQANGGALPGTTKILQKQQEWLSSDKVPQLE